MNEKSVIHVKSYSFAIRIVKLYQYLIKERKEYSLAKQILKSGTSIGANIDKKLFESLLKDCEEILRILSRIQLTTKESLKK